MRGGGSERRRASSGAGGPALPSGAPVGKGGGHTEKKCLSNNHPAPQIYGLEALGSGCVQVLKRGCQVGRPGWAELGRLSGLKESNCNTSTVSLL